LPLATLPCKGRDKNDRRVLSAIAARGTRV
jgi:hypothetical protein